MMKPNTVLEDALVKLGLSVKCMWQTRGQRGAAWAWLECLEVRSDKGVATVIVQTYQRRDGWQAYIADSTNSVGATIGHVVEAAGGDAMKMLPEIAITATEAADAPQA